MSLFRNLLIDKKRRRFYCEVEFITFGEGQYIIYNGEQFPSQPSTIYKHETLLPVLDWSYTPCMYDKVTEQLFYNAGTGNFIAGRQIHPVEYLESTGTQYVDTGVGVKENTVFKATFSIASSAAGYSYFGARNASNERFQIVNSIGIGAGYYLASSVYPIANQKYEIEMHANGDMYLDGVKRSASNGTFSQVAFERNLWLFATNYYDSSVPPGASTFWKVQILEGDTLVRDFVPAIDESGTAYMFDRVSHTCFLNQGTAAFKYPARELEYLESDGNQYIDTGYIPKPTSSYKCDFELTNITTTSGNWFCVFGSVESNNSTFTELFLPRASGGGDVNQVLVGNHNSTYIRKEYAWAINTPYDFEMTTADVFINGVSQGSITVDSSITCNHSIYLFARHEYNDAVRYNVKAKVRDFKVLENNTLVHNFVSCYKDGVACMVDKLTGTAYLAQGTGTLIAGKILEPEYE